MSTSTTTVAQYCGSTEANDPDFPGYVNTALNKVINKLVSENVIEISLTYPEPAEGKDSVYASASCLLDECQGCMDYLLPYVSQCSVYTTGGAYTNGNQCSLSFELTAWHV
ncbi:hypothetical protein LINGRAHAP2_LOCUS29798 [Linum grandiflorum]